MRLPYEVTFTFPETPKHLELRAGLDKIAEDHNGSRVGSSTFDKQQSFIYRFPSEQVSQMAVTRMLAHLRSWRRREGLTQVLQQKLIFTDA